MVDLVVDAHDGIKLSVRDHGGEGPPVVLLHGAGAHLVSVGYLARQLRDFHVVSMDQRWSGRSGDSDRYDWADLVRDVEAVVGALGLENPAVIGHSWGGMIAAHYGRAHPEAPGVVNLDGHGLVPDPALFDGMSEEEARAALGEIDQINQIEMGSAGASGDESWYQDARNALLAPLITSGMKPTIVDDFARRSFVKVGDGIYTTRPAPTLYSGLEGDLGLFDLYREVGCPLLVLDASRSAPTGRRALDAQMAAYRRGLTKVLASLGAEVPNLTVVHLPDADHQSIVAGDAAQVAQIVRRFVRPADPEPGNEVDTG